MARVVSLPATLTLKGTRIVLKTPTPRDDAVMREILSDPLNVQHLPHFQGRWTLEQVTSRREKQTAAQVKGEALTLFIYLVANKTGCSHSEADDDGKDDLILVGTTGFPSMNLETGICEIGIILHHPYWSKGIATEALHLCLCYAFEILGILTVDTLQWETRTCADGVKISCR